MGEEENIKVISKRRPKLTQMGFDSGDDEPIGSLFKLKSRRSTKKVKAGSDNCDNGRKMIEVGGKTMAVEDKDLGGMDDTLASFKKKLRGPKKDSGSALRNTCGEIIKPSGQSFSAILSDRDLSTQLNSKTVEESNRIIDNGFKDGSKRKSKRTKVASVLKIDEGDSGKEGNLDVQGSSDKKDPFVSGENSFDFMDDTLEDSLSAFLQKAQSVQIKKSRSSTRLKQRQEIETSELDVNLNGTTESLLPPSIRRSQVGSKLVEKMEGHDGSLGLAHAQGSTLCKNSVQELSHAPLTMPETLGSSNNLDECPSKKISENLNPLGTLQMSELNLGTFLKNATEMQDGESNFENSGYPTSPKLDIIEGSSTQCLHVAEKDTFSLHYQEPGPAIKNYKEDVNDYLHGKDSKLLHDVEKVTASQATLTEMDYPGGGVPGVLIDDTSRPPDRDQKIWSSSGKNSPGSCLGNDSFEGQQVDTCQGNIEDISIGILRVSASDFEDSLALEKKMDLAVKTEGEVDSDKLQKELGQIQSHSFPAPDARKEIISHNFEELNVSSALSQKEDDQMLHQEKTTGKCTNSDIYPQSVALSSSFTSLKKCNLIYTQTQPSTEISKGTSLSSYEYLSGDEDATGASSPSNTAGNEENNAEDTVSLPDTESKGNMIAGQRAVRKAKKRRHGDMAYEGDADWDVLVNGQDLVVSNRVRDGHPLSKTREKLSENGWAAAVSVGLKARAAGPVEKIKFKETLRRKGGLQEYLECRNYILGLWNRDITRVLPLSDCGVCDNPLVDESPHAALIRDVYAFLDQCGYINFGVSCEKEGAGAEHNVKILKEEKFGKKSANVVADSDDGVSFILGRVKDSETPVIEKNYVVSDDENWTVKPGGDGRLVNLQALESLTLNEPERIPSGDCEENRTGTNPPKEAVNMDYLATKSCTDVEECILQPVVHQSGLPPDTADIVETTPVESSEMPQGFPGHEDENHCLLCDSETSKRIIIVGAGPSGLAAARHLQRQGFHVTVLEARSRIGGRVFTDRSSLSVPVDLGASIITGIEADMDTERRPDPSSLICAQLGIELAILDSGCPLYDTVTGQKVPADLDDALEAEYNSLLDDMVLLVAQNGEHAMKMSLEDGLEFALRRRRMPRLEENYMENELQKSIEMGLDDGCADNRPFQDKRIKEEILSPLERRVMNWHFANLEYGCAASLKKVSLPFWNQDDVYGGFGGAHCMIKGGYSQVVESLQGGLHIHLNHVVTDISYPIKDSVANDGLCNKVTVSTSNGREFSGDAVLVTVPLGCLKSGAIKFSPPLPPWKSLSIQRLGFGVLNKVVLEFSRVFWDDSVDYFGATAEETDKRGQCFMFWNVKKTVGAPVLIALVVGKAAIDGQNISSSEHVDYALAVLRKIFGEDVVPDPVAYVVTDWGRDPYSYGAYSFVAVGSSGEDYDTLGRPVENRVFFAGEATCKEHPDTVGGAMMSGLREAVRIIDVLSTGTDYTAEVEAMEAAKRRSDIERTEIREITARLDAVELSAVLCKNSLDGTHMFTRENLLKDMFFNAKTTAGRLHLAKELLNLPAQFLKSFAGTKQGLSTLNSWILDSMGKDGTQLLRHCVRLLVLVSTDLVAVRLSGIGKTVKEKVCVHTSRDIRAIASQLVSVWIEIFRKEKASNGGLRLLKQSTAMDSSRSKGNLAPGKPPLRTPSLVDSKRSPKVSASSGNQFTLNVNAKKVSGMDLKSEVKPSCSQGSLGMQNALAEENKDIPMSEEEKAAVAAAEAAHAAAVAAAEAYASSGAKNINLPLPKIPSFHKFARREQYAHMDESDIRRNWCSGAIGRQDCLSEIDSRNCRVRDWTVDFSAAVVNLENSKMPFDDHSQRSQSNDVTFQLNFGEHSGESAAVDSSIFTKAWVDSSGSVGIKDYNAIERWQCQAAAANSDFFHQTMHVTDEEDSNTSSKFPILKQDPLVCESSASQVTVNKEGIHNQPRGAERIKQSVVDYVASLLMPLYRARKIDREGYKSIMKKTATKVMEQTTDAEKTMTVFEFLDFKRKNKIWTSMPWVLANERFCLDFMEKLLTRLTNSKASSVSTKSQSK